MIILQSPCIGDRKTSLNHTTEKMNNKSYCLEYYHMLRNSQWQSGFLALYSYELTWTQTEWGSYQLFACRLVEYNISIGEHVLTLQFDHLFRVKRAFRLS